MGAGRMGLRRGQFAMDNADTVVVSVFDTDGERAREASVHFGCPARGSFAETLSLDRPDVVFVCSPNGAHLQETVAALEAGSHVFCEKPLARTATEALTIAAAARPGATVRVGANLRYFPNVAKARELFDSGAIGWPLFFRGWIGHEGWNLSNTWFTQMETSGGGTYLDNGVHMLDLMRWFLGEATSCTGMVDTKHWPIAPVEDNGFGLYQMANGATGFVQASWTEWDGYAYFEIYGSTGYIKVDARGSSSTTVIGDTNGKEERFDFSHVPPNSLKLEFDDYIRELRAGHAPSPNALDGARVVQLATAVYEASRTGQRVELTPVLPPGS